MAKLVLLDTQLIVLLVVGLTSKTIIRKHKNLTEFNEDDYELLVLILGKNAQLLLLPNTVSEASSLLRQHKKPERDAIASTFKQLIDLHRERFVTSRAAVALPEYERLGVTDSAIIACCTNRVRLLTADLDLFIAAQGRGIDAINFNHRREDFGLV